MPSGPELDALRRLVDFVDLVDTPLYNFVSFEKLAPGLNPLELIEVANAWIEHTDDSFTLGADFYLAGVSGLHLPGIDQFSLSFNSDKSATGTLICGASPSLKLDDLEITLEIDKSLLRDAAGGNAKITTKCNVSFDEGGFHFRTFDMISLVDAFIGDTGFGISLLDIELGRTPDTFLHIANAEVTLPSFEDTNGEALKIQGRGLEFGRRGLSGLLSKAAGPPISAKLGDFACEIGGASVTLQEGQLTGAKLTGRLDLSKFLADDTRDSWVAADFHIGPDGVSAALSLGEAVVELHVEGAFSLAVNAIRLDMTHGPEAVLWLSGTLTPEIDGVDGDWPSFAFDEIGITSSGAIRLAEGASIATTQPISVKWHFAKLTVTSFSLQRPEGGGDSDLELSLSAGVELLQGIPAGASVDGLVVTRRKGRAAEVRFDGIGLHFGTPGAFDVAVSVSWNGVDKRFSGSGHLDVTALDLRLQVVFAAGEEKHGAGKLTTAFVAADLLLPGGIPIGATGLSLYGVSGLLAYNKEIDLHGKTGARRYFEAFDAPPKKGFSVESKWKARQGAGALGLGVVIGTGDDGWAFSCRGALLLTFPDIAILAAATGDVITKRKGIEDGGGKLSALLAILPAEHLMRFDFSAIWDEPPLFALDGSGEAEFYDNRPLEWMVAIGKKPPSGKPVSARALKLLGDSYMLSTDYWFRIDAARSANIGMTTGIDWRFGPPGLHVELMAQVSGDVMLAWNPAQLEGDFGISGRARLVGGGLSLAVNVSAKPSLKIAHPTELVIPLKACIELDLGFKQVELCLAFTIARVDRTWPSIEDFVHGLSTVPRHWYPRLTGDPNAPYDSGIVQQLLDANHLTVDMGLVQPHSELVLEFSKSMAVDLKGRKADLNDVATPFPAAIGRESGWAAQWKLTRLELTNVTDGTNSSLFGTFSRSPVAREENGKLVTPRPANTELRLLSSRRFGQDGSLGGGGVQDSPGGDCTQREPAHRRCVKPKNLPEGQSQLDNGWPCEWIYEGEDPRRSNRDGVLLAPEDSFIVLVPGSFAEIFVTTADCDAYGNVIAGTASTVSASVSDGVFEYSQYEQILTDICWDVPVLDSGAGPTQGWKGSSGVEEWTLADAAAKLLIPNKAYCLDVTAQAQLLEGATERGAPRVFERSYVFRTARAPDWSGALGSAVAAKYPDDGDRPIFRDYDLRVRFKDDFYEALYRLDHRVLGVRIRDANGVILVGDQGTVLLPVSWSEGAVTRPPNEEYWGRAHAGAGACEQTTPPPVPRETVLPIVLRDYHLRPLERYIAELVAVDSGGGDNNPTEVLASWSFTTSAYQTYADLIEPPAHAIACGHSQLTRTSERSFDALIRTFDAPVVTCVERMRVVPVRAGDSLTYLLVESPEPLDDDLNRLAITVERMPVTPPLYNLDRTRAIIVLEPPILLGDPAQSVAVEFAWQSAPEGVKDVKAERLRTVAGVPADVFKHWDIPLGALV